MVEFQHRMESFNNPVSGSSLLASGLYDVSNICIVREDKLMQTQESGR